MTVGAKTEHLAMIDLVRGDHPVTRARDMTTLTIIS